MNRTSRVSLAFSTASMLAVGAAGQASAAASTPIVYDGVVIFTAQSAGCAGAGFPTAYAALSTYRPKIASGDPAEALAVNFGPAGFLIEATNSAGSLRGAATFNTTGITTRAQAYGNGGAGTSNLKFAPAAITTTTPNLTVTGTLTNLYGVSSCTITLKGALTQRP